MQLTETERAALLIRRDFRERFPRTSDEELSPSTVLADAMLRLFPLGHDAEIELKPSSTVTPPTEMTRAVWSQMSLAERREWNRPAYEVAGEQPIEYLGYGDDWNNFDSLAVGPDDPCRVNPVPLKLRYWLYKGYGDWEVVCMVDAPPPRHGVEYVELVEKGGDK